jgi:hypothetical protein
MNPADIPSWQKSSLEKRKPQPAASLANLDADPLTCLRLQPRLTKAQTAKFLNMGAHDIPILVRAGLLTPLGTPTASNQKYFATADLVACAEDREWLVKVCDVLYKHWHKLNAAKHRKTGKLLPDDKEE